MTDSATDQLETLLAQVASGSSGATAALRAVLGAEAIFAFVYDADLGVLVPAPGFPGTVPTGRAWEKVLAGCSEPTAESVSKLSLPLPTSSVPTPALVIARAQGRIVVLGHDLRAPQLDRLLSSAALLLQALTAEHATVVARAGMASTRMLLQDADRNQGQLDQALRSLQKSMREATSTQARIDLLRGVAERLLGSEPAYRCLPDVSKALSSQLRMPIRLRYEAPERDPLSTGNPVSPFVIKLPLGSELEAELGSLRAEFDSPATLQRRDQELLEAIAGQYSMALRREKLADQLAQRAEDLAQSMRLREEFLSVAAHELRNPIHIISGFAGVLRREFSGLIEARPVAEEALAHILRSASQMTGVVDGFLDISRMERGTLTLDFSMADLRTALELAVSDVHSDPAFQGHQVSIAVAGTVHFICDPVRLNQALVNLLSNAIKYSPRGGTVAVTAAESANDLVIDISDKGIGIRPEELSHVFDPFVRGRKASEFAPGTGVGLFLTRKIAEAHGGRVTLISTDGDGTTARLTIPRVPPGFTDGPSDLQ